MNKSLTSLVNDVYTLTNRPDLVGETVIAVRNATLKAHNTDYYPKDLLETGIQFGFSLTQQSLDYKNLVPRWKALKYLRKCTVDGVAKGFIQLLTPEETLDNYGVTREDVCYLAGAEIKIRSLTAEQYYLLGCYVHPDVTVDKYSSWIAEEFPSAIMYEAVATVYKTIGFDEQAAFYRQMVMEEYAQLKQQIVASGY